MRTVHDSDTLGELIHTAFRKASDCEQANTAWYAIRNMPDREWSAIIGFIYGCLGETSQAMRDIFAERCRQIEKEGFDEDHDDSHCDGDLAQAAACYALPPNWRRSTDLGGPTEPLHFWPWGDEWWKPGDRRRELVKAGALIAAEIERIDRKA